MDINELKKIKFVKETTINRDEVIELLNQVRYLMFLGFYEDVTNIDEYVNTKLSIIKDLLRRQLKKMMTDDEITTINELFISSLPKIKKSLEGDIQSFLKSDPATSSAEEVILSYPGIYAISVYRIAHELYNLNIPYIPRIMTEHAHNKSGIDIHPGAIIKENFFIDHGTGIVIGETTEIGNNVKIYQGVTLGAISINDASLLRGVKRHPTIKDNVTIYSGAVILGGNTVIGENAIIGSNVFITSNVENNEKVMLKKENYRNS